MAVDPKKIDDLTIDYKTISGVPISQRGSLLGGSLGDIIARELTPTERARLFPMSVFGGRMTGGGSSISYGSGSSGGSGYSSGGYGGTAEREDYTEKQKDVLKEAGLDIDKLYGQKTGGRITGDLSGRKAIMRDVYNGFKNAGFSDKQARSLTAEVGRENGYNPDLIYGSHIDPANSKINQGMFSWQKERGPKLMEFLAKEGVIDSNGKIIPGQAAIDAQAKFVKYEMENNPDYKRTKEVFLSNPDIDMKEAAEVLGNNYIRWRYDDPRYAHHKSKMFGYYDDISSIINENGMTAEPTKTLNEKEWLAENPGKNEADYEVYKIDQFIKAEQLAGDTSEFKAKLFEVGRSAGISTDDIIKLQKEIDNPESTSSSVRQLAEKTGLISALSQVASNATAVPSGSLISVKHGDNETFIERASDGVKNQGIENIDPRLVTVGDAAIRAFERDNPGYTVKVISGHRNPFMNRGATNSRHLRGDAIDYEITDPSGKVLDNLREGSGEGAPMYIELARNADAARIRLSKTNPSLYGDLPSITSGAFFGGDYWSDSMHQQFGGASALGDIYSGYKSDEQLRKEGQPEYVRREVAKARDRITPINKSDMESRSIALYGDSEAPVLAQAESATPSVSESTIPVLPNQSQSLSKEDMVSQIEPIVAAPTRTPASAIVTPTPPAPEPIVAVPQESEKPVAAKQPAQDNSVKVQGNVTTPTNNVPIPAPQASATPASYDNAMRNIKFLEGSPIFGV